MLMPLAFLAGFMTIITAPGLIAQHLQSRKTAKSEHTGAEV